MTILEAMGGKQGEEQATGATIQIPRASNVKSRQWTQLHKDSSLEENLAITSAATMATSATNPDPLTPQLDTSSNYESLKIECRPCSNVGPESGARAFVMGPNPLSIVLCSNRLTFHGPEEMEQVLVHELVHVYDVRINQLDLRGCENLAYSEVRAAREAECKDAWLANRYCIPQNAYRATSNLFPGAQAKACIARVFDTAMADTAASSKTMCDFVCDDDETANSKGELSFWWYATIGKMSSIGFDYKHERSLL
eukprot:CAMPEP_0119031926 /NCGR_PEP_ID=MMETSP1176-20130426/41792_1 /TAXON_ID=265551 /ORGANISM="Synedropsis recta cf, Strain CCMP1620" /LENGTH=253 /DNA_ID=CAMNT_0006988331 /DNA_START=114 /DNA_END=874 /DNA_ORIENTATION=+